MFLAIVISFATEGFMGFDFARFAAAIIIGAVIGLLISSTVNFNSFSILFYNQIYDNIHKKTLKNIIFIIYGI